jgi:RNA polymerase sigma-70 factor (ECF subfamily)
VRSLRAWIFAIARNTAYDFLRTKKHVQFSDLSVPEGESIEETLRDDTYLPDALFAAQESGDTVLAALQKLSPEYRIVVMLHVYEALTFEEVAQVVDRPMNTVKSQYRRALGALRSELVKTMHQSDVHIRID